MEKNGEETNGDENGESLYDTEGEGSRRKRKSILPSVPVYFNCCL